MRLEVRRLKSDKGVTSRVRLIKSVGGECFPVFPDFFQFVFRVVAFFTSLQEFGVHGIQVGFEFFTHCFPQLIRLTFGKTRQFLRQQHHLLLVNGDAVSILQVFFAVGYIVGDGLPAVFARNKVGDVFQGPRTVKGVHRNQVLEGGGHQFLHVLLHPRTFILEDTDRFAALEEFVGFFVF